VTRYQSFRDPLPAWRAVLPCASTGALSAFGNWAALPCPARSNQVRGIRRCARRRNIHRKSAEHDIDAVIATSLAQPALVRPVGAIHQPRSGYARVPTGRRRVGRTGCQLARALAERTDPAVRHSRLPNVLRERGGWDPALYLYCCRDDQQNRGRDQLAGWPSSNLIIHHRWCGFLFDGDSSFVTNGRRFFGRHPATRSFPPTFETRWFDWDNVNATLAELNVPSEIELLPHKIRAVRNCDRPVRRHDIVEQALSDALRSGHPRCRDHSHPHARQHQFFRSASLLASRGFSGPRGID
jgi:hypothetical protein